MARKSEAERYQEWATRIREREAFLARKITAWNTYLRMYRMELSESERMSSSCSNDDSVWLNYQFGLSRIILPSVYFRNPDVIISPRRGTPLTYCVVLEKLINKQFEDIDFDLEMRKIVFDTLFCGIGIMKFGFAPALGSMAKTTQDEFADVAISLYDEDLWEGQNKPASNSDLGDIDQRIPDRMPFAIRISPKHWLVDPLAATDKEARWMVHKVLKSVSDLKKSKVYRKGLTSGIQGNMSLMDAAALNEVPGGSVHGQMNKDNVGSELVYVYECWDRETDKLMVLDSYNMELGDSKFLREDDNPYDIDGFPFEVLCFNPDPETPYGVPDAETWQNPSNAINLLNTMQYEHAKRALPKTLVAKGALGVEAMGHFTSPIIDAVIEVDGDPAVDVKPLQMGTLSPELYGLRDVLRRELTFITGVTEQRKGSSEKSQTATEASIIEQQSRIRDSDRLSAVSKFVTRAARKILMLDRQFLEPAEIGYVVGPEAMRFWQVAGPDIIRSEVDVKVRVGSSAFMSREVRAKQLLDFLNLTSTLVDPATGGPMIDVKEVIRRVAEALDIEDYERLLITPPMPEQPPGMMPQGASQGPQQSMARRGGGTNMGDQLSGVQNVGARQTPNPTHPGAPS